MLDEVDFLHPDYGPIIRKRIERIVRIRNERSAIPHLKAYYKDHIDQFITDWGCTVDPRNVERGIPAVVPFLLFDKQREWVSWLLEHWHNQRPGLTEKSRDCGLSWLSIAVACSICIFYPGVVIGFGSRKEEYVDKIDAPKSLFYKARTFMRNLPKEFRAGHDPIVDSPHLRIKFPETGSNISGEAGDNIGRGDRASIYFVDEAAYLEHPQLIEASLAGTTNCRQDISSVNGMTNPFAEKRHGGKIDVFIFDWRDDPRKDDDWYKKQQDELDPITLAQEVDRNYLASVEGILIPYEWVRSAVDAHVKLGFIPTGEKTGAMDVADEGIDRNAFCGTHGIMIEVLEEWSGAGGDIFKSVEKAFGICDLHGYKSFKYDADGLGAGVRGDARVINEKREKYRRINAVPFRGSGGVFKPEAEDVKGRKNEDFFANLKAQAWWSLRTRFQKTYRAVVEKMPFQPDELISIPSGLPFRSKLIVELSQPTYEINTVGKVVVNKVPEGARSPNLADAVMIRFGNVSKGPLVITDEVISKVMAQGQQRK